MQNHAVLRFLTLLLIAIPCRGISQEHVKFLEIDNYLKACHEVGLLNGAVLVAHQGEVIYRGAFGIANREWGIPNTVATKFNLASVTKQFTALLILQLVEEGKLQLSGTIHTYLPEYRKDTGEKITLHHLLTHTSGLPDFARDNEDFMQRVRKLSHVPVEYMIEYCSGDLLFEPGTKEDYSNSGYFILGMIIERVTGKRYSQVIQERIFAPLGMENSGALDDTSVVKGKASGYMNDFGKMEMAPYMSMSVLHGAGVLYSNVDDMHLWNNALSGDLLSPSSKEIAFKPLLNSQACGWRVGTTTLPQSKRQLTRHFHGGGMPGFLNLVSRFPEDQYHTIFLTNTGGTSLNSVSKMNNAVISILYDEPIDPPRRAPLSVAATLYETLDSSTVEEAVKQFHELKKQSPQGFDCGAIALHTLSVRLDSEGRHNAACKIRRLNSDVNGDVYWTHMNLAEDLLENGEIAEAQVVAKKALDMKPGNERVVDLLRKIESRNGNH